MVCFPLRAGQEDEGGGGEVGGGLGLLVPRDGEEEREGEGGEEGEGEASA